VGSLAEPVVHEKPIMGLLGLLEEPCRCCLGILGGLKRGKARVDALSARKRREIAKKAAQTRLK